MNGHDMDRTALGSNTGRRAVPVPFYDAVLLVEPGVSPATTLVAMRPIVEAMGLDWSTQRLKIAEHPVLAPTVGQIPTVAEDGKWRNMTALPLNRIHFWLATVNPKKVPDPEIRERVIRFQEECADTLYDRFFGEHHRVAAPEMPSVVADGARQLLPGHPDFSQAVRLVREARLSRGSSAALAVWRAVGLPWVPELDDAPKLAHDETDSVARFAIEGIERVPGVYTPSHVFARAYIEFCTAHGLEISSQRSYETRFGRMGFPKRKIGGRMVYLGIRPKAQPDTASGGC
ncbi:hypothetical protein KIO76_18055 [Chelatococcus sp. YT9]|nr:hypothetical protein [Chelatococcus sp. YT9]